MASSARIAKVDRRAVSGPAPGSLSQDLHPDTTSSRYRRALKFEKHWFQTRLIFNVCHTAMCQRPPGK